MFQKKELRITPMRCKNNLRRILEQREGVINRITVLSDIISLKQEEEENYYKEALANGWGGQPRMTALLSWMITDEKSEIEKLNNQLDLLKAVHAKWVRSFQTISSEELDESFLWPQQDSPSPSC